MNIKEITISIIAGIGILTGAYFLGHQSNSYQTAGDYVGNSYIQTISSAAYTVGQIPVLVLATSTARAYAIFSNNSGAGIYLSLSANAPAGIASTSVYVAASTTYTLSNTNLYVGPVYAIAAATTTNDLLVAASQ